MKVLLITADNLYLTPYIKTYTQLFDENKIEYDIIYWNKNDNESYKSNRYIQFYSLAKSKIGKLISYIKFRKLIIEKINLGTYDYVIPLQTIVAFIISNILVKKYEKKFIYDVRDYSYEWNSFYRYVQTKLVSKSALNIISSRGFENFMPKAEYYVSHNIPNMDIENYRQLENKNIKTIVISYIGLIRFMEQNKKIIDFFKNDNRFKLKFIGTNSELLSEYCSKNNVTNVELIGTFKSEDTLEYYKDTDMVMNLYGSNTPLLDYALSNKLYYSAFLHKPILVCKNTFMETITNEYSLGYVLSLNDEYEKDQLYSYYKNIDRVSYIGNCKRFTDDVYKDVYLLKSKLNEIFMINEEKK